MDYLGKFSSTFLPCLTNGQNGQKKFCQKPEKVQLETYFLLMTTPYVMFEWKKNPKILIAYINRKEQTVVK